MEGIRMFVETSWKSPARQDGVAMWLVECMRRGEPITRQGIVRAENGTEAQAALLALADALSILKKPCRIKAFISCPHVSGAVQNGWHLQWRAAGWENAKGKPVRNAGLWEAFLENAAPHTLTAADGSHEYKAVMRDSVKRELEDWKRRKSGNGNRT